MFLCTISCKIDCLSRALEYTQAYSFFIFKLLNSKGAIFKYSKFYLEFKTLFMHVLNAHVCIYSIIIQLSKILAPVLYMFMCATSCKNDYV